MCSYLTTILLHISISYLILLFIIQIEDINIYYYIEYLIMVIGNLLYRIP